MNEWVHINCALWSAEVYEDDVGRLKNVYDAVKRGNKLVQSFKYFFVISSENFISVQAQSRLV